MRRWCTAWHTLRWATFLFPSCLTLACAVHSPCSGCASTINLPAKLSVLVLIELHPASPMQPSKSICGTISLSASPLNLPELHPARTHAVPCNHLCPMQSHASLCSLACIIMPPHSTPRRACLRLTTVSLPEASPNITLVPPHTCPTQHCTQSHNNAGAYIHAHTHLFKTPLQHLQHTNTCSTEPTHALPSGACVWG